MRSSATVTVEDDDAAPVVTTASPVEAAENGTAIATLAATDDDTPAADLAWSIVVGSDSAKFTLSAGGDLAFAAAKDFEAPDDADRNGNYEFTVRVTDGANPVDAAFTVRLADVDEIAPVLSSANVDGDALTLTFDEALDGNSVPDASAFSVAVDGTARGVSGVSMSGSSVTLTLASAVVSDEAVTVGYTAPTGANARPLRDVAGNPGAGFSDEAVTNDTPASNAAPTGLPTISGTARAGETLTASAAGIADADGLANATYAWQWTANDGTGDADIAGATEAIYTLTSAEVGKTVKVRATFTDDRDTGGNRPQRRDGGGGCGSAAGDRCWRPSGHLDTASRVRHLWAGRDHHTDGHLRQGGDGGHDRRHAPDPVPPRPAAHGQVGGV